MIRRQVFRIAGLAAVIFLVSWAGFFLAERMWPRDRVPQQADAIICLGAGMAGEFSPEAGPGSSRRALACASLQQAGLAPVVVFTGQGNEVASAADAMARVAIGAGLPETAIIVEPLAGSTIQNAVFSMALLPEDTARVIVVSDGFHLPRAGIIFHSLGTADVALHPTERLPLNHALRWTAREGLAFWFNLWRAGLYGAGGLLGIDAETRISWFD